MIALFHENVLLLNYSHEITIKNVTSSKIISVYLNQKIGKPNNQKIIESEKTKGSKQINKYCLRFPMSEGNKRAF
jgi:hypothetical protein